MAIFSKVYMQKTQVREVLDIAARRYCILY